MIFMIKAIIFDLDHTLFDRYATLTEIAKDLRSALPVNPALTDNEIAEIMIKADKMCIHRGWEAVQEYITDKTDLFSEKINPGDYFNYLLDRFMYTAVPYPFTVPTLNTLRKDGFKLGVITNGRVGLQEAKLRMLKIDALFDEVIVCGQYGCPKPSLEPFYMMAERLKSEPSEMMYVGDNPLNDVDASRRAGYVPVFVNTAGYWTLPEIEPCELQVETIAEIPTLVNSYNNKLK